MKTCFRCWIKGSTMLSVVTCRVNIEANNTMIIINANPSCPSSLAAPPPLPFLAAA